MSDARVLDSAGAISALSLAAKYLLSRECRDGGFCFYKSEFLEEPNLGDTCAAVVGLRILGIEPADRDRTLRFAHQAAVYGVGYQFCRLETLRALGAVSERELADAGAALQMRPPADLTAEGITRWLLEAGQAAHLKRGCKDRTWVAPLVDWMNDLKADAGGFGKVPNLLDTYLAVDALAAAKVPLPDETRAFVRSLEVPRLGFALTPGAPIESLEVVHSGVVSCRLLGIEPRYPSDALSFALSCQDHNGGFGRAALGLPDVELTLKAIELLTILVPQAAPGGTVNSDGRSPSHAASIPSGEA